MDNSQNMGDGFCTCPRHRDPFDPYYQCSFCERQQEDAQREENEMSERRIYLESIPARRNAPAIGGGYYGRAPGSEPIGMNEQIYCRVSDREHAWTFDPATAAGIVRRFRKLGYPARCEPSVTETY